MNARKTAILDGDHGADDFNVTLMLQGHPDLYDFAGVVTTRGNVSAQRGAHNAGLAVAMGQVYGYAATPVLIGAERTFEGPDLAGDDAFGHDGLGGAVFPGLSPVPVHEQGVDWLIRFLRTHAGVTLYVTGPLTTLAVALQKDPSIKSAIAVVNVMGGALERQGSHNRIGNITPFSEFNFYRDPFAADYVLASDIPLVLYPLDLTHQLVFTPERQEIFRRRLPSRWTESLITMMRGAEHYDVQKFGATGAFFHDYHVVLGERVPEIYAGETMGLRVNTDPRSDEYGRMRRDDGRPARQVMLNLRDPGRAFDAVVDMLAFIAGPTLTTNS